MSSKRVIYSLALAGLAIVVGCRKGDEKEGSRDTDSALEENGANSSVSPSEEAGFDSIHFIKPGVISRYDDIFRKEAVEHDLDWRLLAAVGYTESRFHENLVSPAGARGLMQLMPSVAEGLGISPESMMDPSISIKGGAISLQNIIKWIGSRYNHQNPENLLKIAVATYNCGPAHIEDAMTIASMTGLDPGVWEQNLEQALSLKSQPQYYSHPKVKHGRFSGAGETKAFVMQVFKTFNIYKKAGIPG